MLLVSDAELMEFVIVGAGQEGSFLCDDLETPALSVVMGDVLSDMLVSVDIDRTDSTVVVAD